MLQDLGLGVFDTITDSLNREFDKAFQDNRNSFFCANCVGVILYVFLLANVFKVGEMICIFKHDFQVVGREFYVKSIFIFIVSVRPEA